MTIRFGFSAPLFAGAGDAHGTNPLLERVDLDHLRWAVLEAESLGYDSLWVVDHLMLGRDSTVLEGWTTLSALSGITSRMRLGNIHLSNPFRSPALVAKMAASLDYMSGGRLDFFFEPGRPGNPEADAYGFAIPDDATGIERLEEAIRIIKAMWTEDAPSFQGKHYQIKSAVCSPKPAQRPTIPLWIGTIGSESTELLQKINGMRIEAIARHADWWNNTPASVEHCRDMLQMLRQACQRTGRDYNSIGRSLEVQVLVAETPGQVRRLMEAIEAHNPRRAFFSNWEVLAQRNIIGDVKEAIRRVREYVDVGIQCFMLWFMDYPSLEGLRTFANRVMPYFR